MTDHVGFLELPPCAHVRVYKEKRVTMRHATWMAGVEDSSPHAFYRPSRARLGPLRPIKPLFMATGNLSLLIFD